MVFFKPKQGVTDEEGPYFVSSVIENVTFPVRMITFLGIMMLVQKRPIKIMKAVQIIWKMRRYPIQYYPYPFLVKRVYQEHKVFRLAKPARRCKITRDLI